MYKIIGKKFLDISFSCILLLIASPLLLITSILLVFANKGNPFYFQLRPGQLGKVFLLYKFKTMNEKKDSCGNLLPPKERLTKIGKFIRKTSIDEILQLLNVLKGDMSIVGPRPLRVEYIPLYSEHQARRHEVKPGITGWAQVKGRNSLSWEERFELDVWYVDNVSFALDLKILFLTIQSVLTRKGINAQGEKLMEPFKGIKLNG